MRTRTRPIRVCTEKPGKFHREKFTAEHAESAEIIRDLNNLCGNILN